VGLGSGSRSKIRKSKRVKYNSEIPVAFSFWSFLTNDLALPKSHIYSTVDFAIFNHIFSAQDCPLNQSHMAKTICQKGI
jgi:hypothetical protein